MRQGANAEGTVQAQPRDLPSGGADAVAAVGPGHLASGELQDGAGHHLPVTNIVEGLVPEDDGCHEEEHEVSEAGPQALAEAERMLDEAHFDEVVVEIIKSYL